MKRFRLNTLMLLIVIAALAVALVVQQHRAARREIGLQAELAKTRTSLVKVQRQQPQPPDEETSRLHNEAVLQAIREQHPDLDLREIRRPK